MSQNTVSSSRAGDIGPFFFYIEGLPKKFTWQDLKDLIRTEASHGIWTDMAIYPNGQTGGKGAARVQRSDEARRLYMHLTQNPVENRGLRVHLWDISQSDKEPRFMRCNCDSAARHSSQSFPAQGLEVGRMAMAPGWQTFAPVMRQVPVEYSPVLTGPQYRPALIAGPAAQSDAAASTTLVQAMIRMQLNPRDPGQVTWFQSQNGYELSMRAQREAAAQQQVQMMQQLQQQHQQHQAATRMPHYTFSIGGTLVNTAHGTVRTEARGIFVSGLNYKAGAKDVETLFNRAGEISRCELHKDSTTGKSKGIATIQYASSGEARKAIALFHGKQFMSMRLQVRHDKEATAIRPPPAQAGSNMNEPIIVNGSQVR